MEMENAIRDLQAAMDRFKADEAYSEAMANQQEVLSRYQLIFSPDHVPQITADEFTSFLYFENNKHWHALYRQKSRMTADMDALRAGLSALLDDSRPVAERLDEAVNQVYGMGKAVATAILITAFPHKYGVWNRISEEGLRKLGIWPNMPRGSSVGETYQRINEVLLRLVDALRTDLWTLDHLWWQIMDNLYDAPPPLDRVTAEVEAIAVESTAASPRFGLERHLHDFLRDNWEQTELGREWELYGRPGDDDPGYEFRTDVGRIDLLARHKSDPRWLVVELKRGQTSDQTVGQVLRYMGWVKHHLAEPDDTVEGLIIARAPDQALLYALEMQSAVALNLYEVEFRLKPSSLDGSAAA